MKYISFLLAAMVASTCVAQELDPSELLNAPADTWAQYHGDYSAQRHSKLKQITPANVGSLSLKWAFQTGMAETLKCSPLVVDGVIYISLPDNAWAIDAHSGHLIWHYSFPPNKGFHIGHRGVAMYKGWVY